MRIVAYLAFLIGLFFLVVAGRDEYRGVTTHHGRLRQARIVRRAEDPAGFRQTMAYHWFSGAQVLFVGGAVLALQRRAERLDPLAPDGPNA